MRVVRFIALSVLSLSLAACTSGTTAGWTFEPPPPATPTPAATPASSASGASGSAAPSASAGESAGASAGASAGGSGQAGGPTIKLTAQNIAFDQSALTAPPNTPFTIDFSNQDAGVPHNVTIKDAMGTEAFKGDIFDGPGEKQYQVPALKPGTYTFYCIVHPNMTGTLTVQ